jgi:hypothetical protein
MKRPATCSCVCLLIAIVLLLFKWGSWAQFNIKQHRFSISAPVRHVPNGAALSPGPRSPTGTGRPPRVGPNTQVNAPQNGTFFEVGFLGRSETAIATSPGGRNILVGFNDGQGFCGPPYGAPCTPEKPPGIGSYAFSTNGGLRFTDAGAPDPALFNNVFTRSDPWIDRGGFDNNTFYFANLAVDATTAAGLGVSVHRGHFVGNSFAFHDVRTFNVSNAGDGYDKEAIAAAKDGSGDAYVSVTNFIEVCGRPKFGDGQIELWRTHDGGDSWQGPTIVSPDMTFKDPANPNCGLTGTVQQGSVPAIGPNGVVYVAWLQGPTFSGLGGSIESSHADIKVATSHDGGVTFGSAITVARTNVSLGHTAPAGYNVFSRIDSPRIAVAATGHNAGRVYVAFTSETRPTPTPTVVACPAGLPAGAMCLAQDSLSEEAFLSFSDDEGLTWSTPTRIAPAVPATGVKRMWPVPTVEPGGNLDIIYYESQEVPTPANPDCNVQIGFNLFRVGARNSLVNTFWVQSTNGGNAFSAPVRVTTATSNWCTTVSGIGPNFGDYISSFAAGNRVFACWSDGRNGVPDTFSAVILTAGNRKRGPN